MFEAVPKYLAALVPKTVLLFPVVKFNKDWWPTEVVLLVEAAVTALVPTATLAPPLVVANAPTPIAVFALAVLTDKSAPNPTAVLLVPVVSDVRALAPTAVFCSPVVFASRAPDPTAVLFDLVLRYRAL